MTELQKRVLVAAVGIPLGLAVIHAGDALLAALLGMVAALGAREFFAIAEAEGAQPFPVTGIVMAALIPLGVHASRLGIFDAGMAQMSLILLIPLVLAVLHRGPQSKPASAAAITVMGVLYTSATISFAYSLRYHDYVIEPSAGTALLLFPLVVTWVCDSAAYFAGRTFGKRKLMPAVSPGKTVEGAIGGLLGAALASLLYAKTILPSVAQLGMSLTSALLFGIVIAAVAQVGDLVESLFKRSAGVKDSSSLLPGHGGILDRFDSLYFALPVAHILLSVMLLPAPRL